MSFIEASLEYRKRYPKSDIPVRILSAFFSRGIYPACGTYQEFIRMYRR